MKQVKKGLAAVATTAAVCLTVVFTSCGGGDTGEGYNSTDSAHSTPR